MPFSATDIRSIWEIYAGQGTRIAKGYVYRRWKVKLTGRELRALIGVPAEARPTTCKEAHLVALRAAGSRASARPCAIG